MNSVHYKEQLLDTLYAPFRSCVGCHFKMPRATQIVLGEGNPNSQLLFIGEAPGREEDLEGRPFVGKSGKLLDRIFDALSISRNDIFITNIVKCRPPNNRRPLPQEIERSKPLLYNQIKIIRPSVICTLGSAALEGLIGEPVKITQRRGKSFMWNNITILPTYHPAFVLRNPKELNTLFSDIEKAFQLSQKKIPIRDGG